MDTDYTTRFGNWGTFHLDISSIFFLDDIVGGQIVLVHCRVYVDFRS